MSPYGRFKLPITEGAESTSELSATEVDSRFALFVRGVLDKLSRCRVYFNLCDVSKSTFKVEILAIATVDGRMYSATIRTANVSLGANDEKVISEAQNVSVGIAKMLGVRIFNGKGEAIPRSAMYLFVEPA